MTRRIQIERAAELEIAEITIALRERQPASATKVLVPPGERLLTSPHVRARGIERQRIFQADAEREDFVQRLAGLAETKALTVYAWALLPNHFHLLVRTKRQPLARSMRSLLAGYEGAFNRRYRRSGHVFQNRYKSVVCDEAVYFLALVRSLHLNPLRARSVADLEGLAKYAYSEPVVLVETRAYGWQDTEAVLTQFGMIRRRAQREYLRFVAAGVSQGRRVELQGGGLIGVPVFSKVGRVPRAEHHYRCAAHQKPRVIVARMPIPMPAAMSSMVVSVPPEGRTW